MKNVVTKIAILSSLCCLLFLPVHAMDSAHPKVAVVLSGGGAKGMAHIGVLKVLQQKGIPIDIIVGTSMGSIIGGLYAIGYTPLQLDTLVRSQDWSVLLSDKTPRSEQTISERDESAQYLYTLYMDKKTSKPSVQGMVAGRNLEQMFKKLTFGHHQPESFDSLPTPFACVATNVVDGSEQVFHHGIISQAMRASMAIPGVFTPVRMDSMVLLDGGMVNNFPADVARAMGADLIIGVDFKNEKVKARDLKSLPQILNNIINLETRKKIDENTKLCDVHLTVDTRNYTAASFTSEAIDSLIRYGEETAHRENAQLDALCKKLMTRLSFQPVQRHKLKQSESFNVGQISFDGVSSSERQHIMRHCHLSENRQMTFEEIEQIEHQMTDELLYEAVTYTLSEMDTLAFTSSVQGTESKRDTSDKQANARYHLKFQMQDGQNLTARFGARLDNEEIASLLLNTQYRISAHSPQKILFTTRLGKRVYGQLNYQLETSTRRLFDAYYRLEYNDINLYNRGDRNYNIVYNLHRAGLGYQNNFLTNFRYQFLTYYSYYYYRDFLTGPSGSQSISSDHLFSYAFQLDYDNYDKAAFPQKGTRLYARYDLHTDNLYQYKDHAPFHTVAYLCESVHPLSSNRLYLLSQVSGRHILGDEFAYVQSNFIGGSSMSHYFEQQLPFPGINNVELVGSNNINLTMKLRERIASKSHVWLSAGVGALSNDLDQILSSRYIWGVETGFGMESILGPLCVTIGYSGYTQKFNLCVDLGWHF